MKNQLACLALLFLAPALAADKEEETWAYLLPPKFTDAELSPNGQFLFLKSRFPYDFKQDRNTREKEGRSIVSPSDYIFRGYVWDLKNGDMTLAGPPDKEGAGQDYGDNLSDIRWTDQNTLLMETYDHFHEFDPAQKKTTRSINIHGGLREASALSLPSSLDQTMLFYSGKWIQGYKVSLWSYQPSKRKMRRLPTPFVIGDVVAQNRILRERNVFSFHTTFGAFLEGYTYSLDENGEFHSHPLKLPGDWRFYTLRPGQLGTNEMLAYRRVEDDTSVVEAKLFDFTTSTLQPGTLQLTLGEFEEAIHLITKPVINTLRAAKGPIALSDHKNAEMVGILDKLGSAFPEAEFVVDEPIQNDDRALVRVSAANRPLAWYLYDKKASKLLKLLEAYPDLAEKQLSETELLTFSTTNAPDRTASLVVARPSQGAKPIGTLIQVKPQESMGHAWEYSRTREYLVAEGFAVVSIKLPWNILLEGAQADSPDQFASAQQNAKAYLQSALRAVSDTYPSLLAEPESVRFSLETSAASFFPALPAPTTGSWGTTFLIDPRFSTGLPDTPHSQILTAQSYPFDRLFDATKWARFAAKISYPKTKDATIIGRENHHRYFSLSEQIKRFENYAEDAQIAVEVDRFNWAGYKVLPYWKRYGSTAVAIADHIKDRKSTFDRLR